MLKIKLSLWATYEGLIASWNDLIFLEIISPFLSTISLLNKENFDLCSSKLKTSFLSKEIWIIFIEKIIIKEKKKKNSK